MPRDSPGGLRVRDQRRVTTDEHQAQPFLLEQPVVPLGKRWLPISESHRELTEHLFDGNYWHNPQSPRSRAVLDAYQK